MIDLVALQRSICCPDGCLLEGDPETCLAGGVVHIEIVRAVVLATLRGLREDIGGVYPGYQGGDYGKGADYVQDLILGMIDRAIQDSTTPSDQKIPTQFFRGLS